LPEQGAAKHAQEESFWVCRTKDTGQLVSASGSRFQTVAQAKKKGYERFIEGAQLTALRLSHIPQQQEELAAYKIGRCEFARMAFWREVDALVFLYNSDHVWVRCPLWEVCERFWWDGRCVFGRIEENTISQGQAGKFLSWAPWPTQYFQTVYDAEGAPPESIHRCGRALRIGGKHAPPSLIIVKA
jgi:hypothetical protein